MITEAYTGSHSWLVTGVTTTKARCPLGKGILTQRVPNSHCGGVNEKCPPQVRVSELVVVLFGEVMELSGRGALLEEVCPQGWALRMYGFSLICSFCFHLCAFPTILDI